MSEATVAATARVLVVEDDLAVRRVVAGMLAMGGLEAVAVETGAGLRDALAGNAYDVVVTDMMMPEVDGLDVLEWVRANRPAVPVVLLSALSGREFEAAGFDAVLTKPVRKAVLLGAIERALAEA